jgi:hypothetical protein
VPLRTDSSELVRWLMLVIPATWEVEIRRIMIQYKLQQKVRDPISINTQGVVVHTCHPAI